MNSSIDPETECNAILFSMAAITMYHILSCLKPDTHIFKNICSLIDCQCGTYICCKIIKDFQYFDTSIAKISSSRAVKHFLYFV